MAYPNPSYRPPPPQQQQQQQYYGGPTRDARGGNRQQQGQGYHDGYQQDWSQDGNYQEYGDGYDQYHANANAEPRYQDGYAARDQGRPNAYNRDMRQDPRYDLGYGDYNGYQESHRDPRQRPQGRDRQPRPPPQTYPSARPMNGERGALRPRPPRGAPNGGPPPMNGYGSGSRTPRDPRVMRPPPSQHDRRQFQPEPAPLGQTSWDNPFPKWPANADRGRDGPSGRRSQDQARYDAGMEQPHQNSRSVSSWEHATNNDYNGYAEAHGWSDQQHPNDTRRPPEEGRRKPPPQFTQLKDQPPNQRPSTATTSRGFPPQRLDIPPKSRTQPTTPVGDMFPTTNSAGPVSPPVWQEPMSAPTYQAGTAEMSLPLRPGTAPGRPQPEFDTNLVRSMSPEEMPAFDRSWSDPEPDPLHTKGGRTGSNNEYVPYSPQDGPAPQKSQRSLDIPRELPGMQYGQPRNGPGPRAGHDVAHPPQPQGGRQPPQGRPPIRRNATDGAEYGERERAPGPRPGPPPNFSSARDPRGNAQSGPPPPPSLDRLATSFNEKPSNQPRSAPGPGPDRTNVERPNFYPSMQGGAGAQRLQGQPIPGQIGAPNTNAASGGRADGNRQGPPVQAQKPGEPARQKSDSDTLPHHPVPVRPGLVPTGSSNERQKPPPVRQYNKDSVTQNAEVKSGPVTPDELSRLREIVSKNPSDKKTKLLLAKRLSEASVILADDGGRADMRMRNHNRDRFNREGLEIVKSLAASEYTDGMFYLAECYGEGALGLRSDSKEAFILYQSAAKLGHPAASYRTAVCCEIGAEEGGGTRKDPQKAVQWYKHASSLGDIPATYKMGVILLKGLLGQQKNMEEAIAFLKAAAENANEENPHALHELALIYESPNNSMTRDEQHAMELFTQAGKLGYKFSQFKLGQAYEYGLLGCAVDARKSIVWYTKAAAQGEHQSELALSGWYLTGSEGILEHNDTEAYLWARKAASADPPLPKAMFAMGYFTEVGIGCPRSLEEAKKWYARSASNRHPKAQERLDELRRGGSKAQKSNREKLSRSNQKQTEENCQVM